MAIGVDPVTLLGGKLVTRSMPLDSENDLFRLDCRQAVNVRIAKLLQSLCTLVDISFIIED